MTDQAKVLFFNLMRVWTWYVETLIFTEHEYSSYLATDLRRDFKFFQKIMKDEKIEYIYYTICSDGSHIYKVLKLNDDDEYKKFKEFRNSVRNSFGGREEFVEFHIYPVEGDISQINMKKDGKYIFEV